MVLEKEREKKDKREEKRKEEEEEEEKRKEERRKGKRRSQVWNYEYLYVNYVCMELVKLRMEKCRFLYNSMGLSSFWYRKYRYMVCNPLSCVWFGFGNSQTHFFLGLS